jgi:YVTN family beta-propeller protein/autotransporter-associated beta strand protein
MPIFRTLLTGCLLLAAPVAALAQAPTKAYAFIPHLFGDVTAIDTGSRAAVPLSMIGQNWQAATSPDGRLAYVAVTNGSLVRVVDVATLQLRDEIVLGGSLSGVAFTPDARRVYATSYFDTVYVVDVGTSQVGAPIAMPAGSRPMGVAAAPDGQRMFVLGEQVLYAIDTTTHAIVDSVDLGDDSQVALAVTPDGRSVLVVDQASLVLWVVDTASMTVAGSIPVGNQPSSVAVAPHGQFAYVTNRNDDAVGIVDLVAMASLIALPVGSQPFGVAFTADGRYAYVTNVGDDTVTVIDTAILSIVATIPVGGLPFSQGGQFITPNLLVGDAGPVAVGSDSVFSALGFGAFVPIMGGGVEFTRDVTTTRHLSILTGDAGVHTVDGATATLLGNVIGDGGLFKSGTGTLRFEGAASHAGGTVSDEGGVVVNGTHGQFVAIFDGMLSGRGTFEDILVFEGVLAPGDNGIGVMHTSSAFLDFEATLAIEIAGTTPGIGYDQLDATLGTCLSEPTLQLDIAPAFLPTAGMTFTIATNVCGEFADLAQDAVITASGRRFRIDYAGGDGDDVVLTALGGPPVITSVAPQRITESDTMSVALAVTDPDGDVSTCAASSSDGAIVDTGTGVGAAQQNGVWHVTAAPRLGAIGALTITASCVDASGQSSNTVSIALEVVPTTYYLAEGATGSFFDTDVAVLNPNATPAPFTASFWREGGTVEAVRTVTLAPLSRTVLQPEQIAGFEAAAFSTRVMSTGAVPLAVDRSMRWDTGGYGAHAERATPGPALRSWFAEGSQGYFSTFLLLNNPHPVTNLARVTYFREQGAPVVRDYPLPQRTRTTIYLGADLALVNASFGIQVEFTLPAIAERVMYFGTSPLWEGGHASAGSTLLSTSWFMAEGATGSYFNTFILVANPNGTPADVTLTYFPATGVPVTKTVTIPAGQRLTRNIALEDPSLANAAVATRVESTLPVVAERSQYWGVGRWIEGHNSAGVTGSALRWAMADGRVGGADAAQTYVLLANTGSTAASVTATFVRNSGAPIVKSFTVPPTSRFNVSVTGPGSQVPELADESFGAVLESTQPIVVERSVYSNANGVVWAAGTNATATPLP